MVVTGTGIPRETEPVAANGDPSVYGTDLATVLSPLQQGMVYHAATNPLHGIDIEQIQFSATEGLDAERLIAAFHTVNNSHPELRTGFGWQSQFHGTQGQAQPSRFIGTGPMPFEIIDLSATVDAGQQWIDRVQADRLNDFDLASPPLQRLLLASLGHDKGWRALWTFHHAILDGRSFSLVLADILDCYQSIKPAAHPTAQPSPRPSFDQHIAAVTQANTNHPDQEEFWTDYLRGVRPDQGLSLEAEVATNVEHQFDRAQFASARFHLSEAETLALGRAADSLGCTMNTMIQAAWAILLHHHLGWDEAENGEASDVVFGTTRACRHLTPDSKQMLGLLINTLPTRATIKPDTTLAELCDDLARHQLDLRAYETTPLPDIKTYSGLHHGQELFRSLVMYDDQTLNQRMAAIDTGPISDFSYKGQTNFPLALICYGGPQLDATLEYDRIQISDHGADQLSQRLRTVLSALSRTVDAGGTDAGQSDAGETLVRYLAYLSDNDHGLLAAWNDTNRAYGPEQTTNTDTLIDLFDAQVERTPRAVALTFGETTLSYGQFKRLALNQADQLVAAGVTGGDVVAIVAERSLEMMVAIYGTLYAGAAYCPIDPDYPAERARFIIQQSEAKIVLQAGLTSPAFASAGGTTASDRDTISVNLKELRTRQSSHRLPRPAINDLAYVIYTSGSTGKPKGCANEHGGIANRLLWMQETFQLDQTDTVLQKTPFTFDVSVWELFWPLQVGACLAIAKPGDHKEPAKLAALIQGHRVTTIHFVPSMLRAFVDSLTDKTRPLAQQCSSLLRIICSGEALPKDLADECVDTLEVELHNLYGPTEAAVDVTWHQHQAGSDRTFVPIGAAIANTRMRILDPMLQPVPPGVAGELFICGIQVCRGYLGRPDLTAERFIPEPGQSQPGQSQPGQAGSATMYRTGDVGRHLADGQIQYLGRTDHQVKIRGFRIELGEIELALVSHPAVGHCVVVDREIGKAGRQLVAYLVQADPGTRHDVVGDQEPSDQEIRRHVSESLADYMVPTHLVWLEALPLSGAGKVDRKRLPEPAVLTVPGTASELPQGEREEVVAQIWRTLIDAEVVARDVPFFAAGGHSLLAIGLAMQLTEVAGREISVTDILDAPTVADQAQLLAKTDDDLVIDLRDTASPAGKQNQRRLSGAQRNRRQASGKIARLESLED